jgi:hypothetical protein
MRLKFETFILSFPCVLRVPFILLDLITLIIFGAKGKAGINIFLNYISYIFYLDCDFKCRFLLL